MDVSGSTYKAAAYHPSPDAMEDAILQTLSNYPSSATNNLIPILQQVQRIEGYVSPEAIRKISNHLRISRSRIFGRHSMKICLGSACHVQGGDFLAKALQLEIGITPGQTSEDRRFDLERVACLGCCALAPVMMVDQDIHSRVSVINLQQILGEYE